MPTTQPNSQAEAAHAPFHGPRYGVNRALRPAQGMGDLALVRIAICWPPSRTGCSQSVGHGRRSAAPDRRLLPTTEGTGLRLRCRAGLNFSSPGAALAEELHIPAASTWPRTLAIIGGGTTGLGVAESFIVAGRAIRLLDMTPQLTREARARLVERVRGHVEAGLLDHTVLERAVAVEVRDTIEEAVRDVDLVVEAVPEQRDVKNVVLAASAAAAPVEAIIATNTSSIPIDELAVAVPRPERLLGMHWFNPPEWMPSIELTPGTATNPDAVAQVRGFLRTIGKRPVTVVSSPPRTACRAAAG